jgi:hypothetical protein
VPFCQFHLAEWQLPADGRRVWQNLAELKIYQSDRTKVAQCMHMVIYRITICDIFSTAMSGGCLAMLWWLNTAPRSEKRTTNPTASL